MLPVVHSKLIDAGELRLVRAGPWTKTKRYPGKTVAKTPASGLLENVYVVYRKKVEY